METTSGMENTSDESGGSSGGSDSSSSGNLTHRFNFTMMIALIMLVIGRF